MHDLLGFAKGLAVGRGESQSTDHLLAALLWDPDLSSELTAAGIDRAEVAAALARRGGPEIDVQPDPERRPQGETVYFPRSKTPEVLQALSARCPRGSWGFNYEGGYRAWVSGDADLPLREIVEEVLRR
jgi:hypothetical protein